MKEVDYYKDKTGNFYAGSRDFTIDQGFVHDYAVGPASPGDPSSLVAFKIKAEALPLWEKIKLSEVPIKWKLWFFPGD